MKYTPVGVDIEKHMIQIHFIDEHSGEVVDKQLRRHAFLAFFSNRAPCLIGMEACGCSGQVKLASILCFSQYSRLDSFGVNPRLY